MATAVILMGVSGCGKTAAGRELSKILGWNFIEGDDYHSPENIEKMTRGIPLNDADRQPWLGRLRDLISENLSAGKSMILACSALKSDYRIMLRERGGDIRFVHLQGDYDLIRSRLEGRDGHFMKAIMLRSQFADLESPRSALEVDINKPVAEIAAEILEVLDLDQHEK